MAKVRVGILRGGPSSEYEVSLETGGNVLKFLPEKYKGFDVLLTKRGEWHINGLPATLDKISRSVDVVFNALHGEFGEDGKVQRLLESHKIPYTGSGVLASALAMNKVMSRKIFQENGIKVPLAVEATKGEQFKSVFNRVFQKIGPWWVVKPTRGGSSIGVRVVRSLNEFEDALKEVFQHDETAIIEEFIQGREATCGIIENFYGEKHYALPVVEIVPSPKKTFFDYEAKYGGKTLEICPSHFDNDTKKEIEDISRKAHVLLGCRHYSRSDMIVSKRGVYLLETNTLPGLTTESLLPKSAEAVGLAFPKLLDHIIGLALGKKAFSRGFSS